jgi:hypothetical protein
MLLKINFTPFLCFGSNFIFTVSYQLFDADRHFVLNKDSGVCDCFISPN